MVQRLNVSDEISLNLAAFSELTNKKLDELQFDMKGLVGWCWIVAKQLPYLKPDSHEW